MGMYLVFETQFMDHHHLHMKEDVVLFPAWNRTMMIYKAVKMVHIFGADRRTVSKVF